jgi:lipoyl(octanoyl) transferase
VRIQTLGLADYQKTWELQRELLKERRLGRVPDTLLLLEHPPVYTRGISSQTPAPPNLPHPAHLIERGGDWTYHGHGQLVGYPIVHLAELQLTVSGYLRLLEEILIDSLRPLGLKAEVIKGFTGVWCENKKIASIGIAVKNGIAYHGFSLNVCCDLGAFKLIYPCKLEPQEISSLEVLLKRPIEVKEAQVYVAETFLKKMGERSFCPA